MHNNPCLPARPATSKKHSGAGQAGQNVCLAPGKGHAVLEKKALKSAERETMKITKISMSRGQTVQFTQYEPTVFHVFMEAELQLGENEVSCGADLSKIVQTELNKQIREKELEMMAKEKMSVDERLKCDKASMPNKG